MQSEVQIDKLINSLERFEGDQIDIDTLIDMLFEHTIDEENSDGPETPRIVYPTFSTQQDTQQIESEKESLSPDIQNIKKEKLQRQQNKFEQPKKLSDLELEMSIKQLEQKKNELENYYNLLLEQSQDKNKDQNLSDFDFSSLNAKERKARLRLNSHIMKPIQLEETQIQRSTSLNIEKRQKNSIDINKKSYEIGLIALFSNPLLKQKTKQETQDQIQNQQNQKPEYVVSVQLNQDEERNKIQSALDNTSQNVTYKYQIATKNNFKQALTQKIVGLHFSGHGQKSEEKDDFILLEDECSIAYFMKVKELQECLSYINYS